MASLSNHAAPGQALGYFFQLERSLYWLVKAPADSLIGIETEDDIVIKLANGESIFEQDKSSTTTHPFNISRKDIWKTLLIWAEAISSGEIRLEHSYFFLVTNKSGRESIAATLSEAKDSKSAAQALEVLKTKAKEISGEVSLLAAKLLQYPDDILISLIERISYQSGDGLFGKALERKLESGLQLDMETHDQNISIIRELTGWVFQQATQAWREKKAAWIDRNAFHREKINILTNYRQTVVDEVLIALGEIPESENRLQWQNRYVKQLQLINCTKEEILKAIYEYLNSVAKRTMLARNGYVTQKQIDDLDRNLEEHWVNIYKSRKISHKALQPEEIGQIIYYDTTDYDTTVGRYVLKSHFVTKGSYHALADKLKVGWHPEFRLHFELRGTELKTPKTKKNARISDNSK
jgi:hypothetical protein